MRLFCSRRRKQRFPSHKTCQRWRVIDRLPKADFYARTGCCWGQHLHEPPRMRAACCCSAVALCTMHLRCVRLAAVALCDLLVVHVVHAHHAQHRQGVVAGVVEGPGAASHNNGCSEMGNNPEQDQGSPLKALHERASTSRWPHTCGRGVI
eukprot:1160525-Pelagomonas_calceolata.AAC.13